MKDYMVTFFSTKEFKNLSVNVRAMDIIEAIKNAPTQYQGFGIKVENIISVRES
jgi:hypothetical protein